MFREGDGKILDGMEDLGCLFNGVHLYREPNTAGGHIYYSDECGVMSMVWDTCIINETTLLAAILAEKHRKYQEQIFNRNMEIERSAATGGSFLHPVPNKGVE